MRSVLIIIMCCFILQACENQTEQSVIPNDATASPIYTNSTYASTKSTRDVDPSSSPAPAASAEFGIIELGIVDADLDGDGNDEQIRLIYDASLKLITGDKSIVVTDEQLNLEDSTSHLYLQKPAIFILQAANQKKVILVSIVWATNKIGSTAKLWVYEYQNKDMQMIWNSGDSNPTGKAEYDQKQQSVSVQFPDYGINQNVVLNDAQKDWIEQLAEASNEHQALLPDLTEYSVALKDGQSELMTKRLVAFDSAPYYLGSLYTYYQIKNGKVLPVKAIFKSS